jgi:hypothetical protein
MAMLFVALQPGEEAERRLRDRMVDTLLNGTDPTYIQRAGIVVRQLDCKIGRRLLGNQRIALHGNSSHRPIGKGNHDVERLQECLTEFWVHVPWRRQNIASIKYEPTPCQGGSRRRFPGTSGPRSSIPTRAASSPVTTSPAR